ncbi:MAG: hypothetical protein ABIY71_05510 [Flavobacteriales bacterium]
METKSISPSLSALPEHARVWVYKSAVPFSADQKDLIRERGAVFTQSWAAHGAALAAALDVVNDHFVVLGVDQRQAMASGCSIDTSVQFIQQLERELGQLLTDRMVVLYEKDGVVHGCRVPEVEDLIKSGALNADTIVFDDLVTTKADLEARFRTSLRNSWMARYL